jgi:hypothetical protein
MGGVISERLTRREKVLLRLAQAAHSVNKWVSSPELCRPSIGGIDFRRRIHELRTKGRKTIIARRVPGRTWNEYRLIEG